MTDLPDVELCQFCGGTLHDPEKDVFREDTTDHECEPMLRSEIARLTAERDEARQAERDWIKVSNDLTTHLEAAEAQVARLTADLAEAGKTVDRWQNLSRDTFEAMCAMRNAINEHIPMPSLESDLLQGPENSVFCAEVAGAVVGTVMALRSQVADAYARGLRDAAGVARRHGDTRPQGKWNTAYLIAESILATIPKPATEKPE